MAYNRHFLLAFGGTMAGGEIWSNSVRMAFPVGGGDGDYSAWMGEPVLKDLVADVRAFMGGALVQNTVKTEWVKWNAIGTDGKYYFQDRSNTAFLAGTTGDYAVISGSSASTTLVPNQIAIRATLLTDRQRGPGSKGGFFLIGRPNALNTLGTDGRISVSGAEGIRGAVATFLNNLNNWPGIELAPVAPRVVIATQGGINAPDPANVPVTAVTVGRVLDTIQKRKNALVEAYVAPAPVS